MRKIVLDTNCLLMSLPKISPYRMIWDEFLKGQLILCVSNEMIVLLQQVQVVLLVMMLILKS